MIPWQTDLYAEANIIITIQNTGSTWIELQPGESDYTIYDADGNVATTGSFLYAYPRFLGPGETGYIADSTVTSDAKAEDFVELETNSYFDEIEEDEAILLTTDRIKNRPAPFDFEGITTSGRITNASSEDVTQAHVGAFYLDAAGIPLGFSSTNLVENLAAGQTKGFETVSGAPPALKESSINSTVVLASPSY